MEFFYIENENKKLFSTYYEPVSEDESEIGIVLLYPIGQEYIRCHRIYQVLAAELSRNHHVITFDFSGYGDSSGEVNECDSETWLTDIELVIDEFKSVCGIEKLCLLGARFGGSLAAMYASRHPEHAAALWFPVHSGQEYLADLETSYQNWLNGSFAKEGKNDGFFENFGIRFSDSLMHQLKKFEISDYTHDDSVNLLLIGDKPELAEELKKGSGFIESNNAEFWIKSSDDKSKSYVPIQDIRSITQWVTHLASI